MTTFNDQLRQFGGMPVGFAAYTGNWFFVNPATGSDGNSGTTPDDPLATLYRAHLLCTAGNNDVVVLIGNGSTTATARLSVANAVSADPTNASPPTTGTLTWSKNATHLLGVCPPVQFSQRARIAPPTGTYTATTFNANIFVNVTASGCHFENFEIFCGFSTGSATMVALQVTGGRNYFKGVHIAGIADAASAAGTGARSVLVSGTGENTFDGCTIGEDTTTRSVANASLEFAAGTPRNQFYDCIFPFMTSSASVLGILGTGAACVDRTQTFRNCSFQNAIKSTSTVMTALISFTSASPGGLIELKDCSAIGITKWGDTNGLANTYIMTAAPAAATSGLAVNPS